MGVVSGDHGESVQLAGKFSRSPDRLVKLDGLIEGSFGPPSMVSVVNSAT